MKNLIDKIDVCEPAIEQALEWLSQSGDHGLNEGQCTDIIRFLLKELKYERNDQ